MTRISKLHEKWSSDPNYRAAYDSMGDEFALPAALIELGSRAGLAQEKETQADAGSADDGRAAGKWPR